ncbi:hypothetical protein TGRH88_068010 [Toxoplasma gondii]|uniref:Uncharacterized protein n=1 Tax=Toxoplasma gondii TaxID=5811 RepID=A0A7J6K0P5_TOXGO|nr:hypothetical protein TGRH88_068010 [Toxoplasma gondii]
MMTHQSDGAMAMQSENTVEPLFQLLVHKVTIENFDLMRDLGDREDWDALTITISNEDRVFIEVTGTRECNTYHITASAGL